MEENETPNPNGSELNNTNAPGADIAGGAKKMTGKVVEHEVEKVKAKAARKLANWIRNKLGKESLKSAAKLSLSGPLGLLLLKVFVVLLIAILLIGIVMFIVTMPGMIMEKLKNLAEGVANAWNAWWGQSTAEQVEDEKVYETLDYIEDMGYDLKGHGFLTDYTGNEEQIVDFVLRRFDKVLSAAKILDTEDPVSYDDKVGVVRNEEGNIKYAASDFIIAYLASENYIYTIKNFNLDNVNWGEALFSRIGAMFTDNLNNRTGMIVLKHEGSEIGEAKMGIVNEDTYDRLERGNIKIDPKSKTLVIKRGWFNPKMKFSLDGWTGRYGMPVDFLVAIQTATFMPDLAYDMTQKFNTEVHVLLHKADNGSAIAAYKNEYGKYITFPEISKAINGMTDDNWLKNLITEIDQWGLNKNEAQKMFDLGIVPPMHNPPDCGCEQGLKSDNLYWYNEVRERDPENGTPDDTSDDVSKYYYVTYEIDPNTGILKIDSENNYVCKKDEDGNVIETPLEDNEVYVSSTKIGEECKKYLKAVVNYADANNYDSFDTYTPYIEKVKDHWFRDVYFVKNSNNDVDFVDMDYDYESVMKERWTLYEKYTADESYKGKYNYNPDKAGQEILFVMDDDGNYATESNGEYKVFDGTVEDANPSVLYFKDTNGDYSEYTDGLATAKDNGITLYRKTVDDDYVEYTGNVAVSKKAVTIDIAEEYEDLGWNKMGTNSYSAYSPEEKEFSEWQPIYQQGVEKYDEQDDETKKSAMERLFVEVKYGMVSQTGEGQRTETNPKIKKMFLSNNYFRYDGSAETAEIITELRYKVYQKRVLNAAALGLSTANIERYGPLTEEELDDEYQITYGVDEKKKTEIHKVGDYAGKLEVLTQDALNAFAMLENTHTLDADYIYRDFKELIVELGYFEKEQLTDETPRLLQFPIPSIGSAEYPARSIDKRVNVDGTMLHSKYDIDTNNTYINLEIAASMVGDLDNDNSQISESTETPVENSQISNADAIESEVTRVVNSRLSLSANPIVNTSEVGAVNDGRGKKTARQVPLKEFLKKTREMCEFINNVGYDYCVLCEPGKSGNGDTCTCTTDCVNQYASSGKCQRVMSGPCTCQANHCKHSVHSNSCYLAPDFETSKSNGKNNFCCDRLVKWALQNVDIIAKDGGAGGAKNLGDYIMNTLGAKRYPATEPLKEGDIVYSSGHIEIVGEKKNGGFVQYNGGHEVPAGSTEGNSGSCIGLITQPFSGAEYILRLPWGIAEDAMYEGYEGNEAVVSPVTGILIDYGVYNGKEELKRENIDLKYGPTVSIHLDEEGNVESIETNTQNATENTEQNAGQAIDEDEEYVPVFDSVGYAIIRVLSKDDFENIENGIKNHYWSNYNGKKGLLDDITGVFEEAIKTEDDLEGILKDTSMTEQQRFLAETIYGYKEFAELYSTYGIYIDETKEAEEKEAGEEDEGNTEEVKKLISGYTIYIDGFKCELPDDNFIDTNEDGSVADETTLPDGKDLTLDSFRISPSNISNENELIQTQYEMPDEYRLASKKASEKLNVEELIKADAYPVMEVDDVIYIKEGTVIGRTFTDKEVVEVLRKDKNEKVEDYKISLTKTEEELSADDYKFEDKLIGNYLTIKMYDSETTAPIEDVENYMKLDEIKYEETDTFSILGTVLSRDEWVEMAYEYATNHGADSVFTNKDNLGKMYDICVEHGVNPEYIFVRGVQESGLRASNGNNYWGYNTPNGAALWDGGTWDNVLTLYCETINTYQDPSTWQYEEIMKRYEERKNCMDNGGIDPLGFGKPDTIGGQMCLYSWLGDDHSANSAGGGGMYYLYPWGWGGNQYEGENKIIFESKAEFESICGSQHNTSGGKTSNVATTVWEQGMYTAYQSRKIVEMAKNIFGERAGTYR